MTGHSQNGYTASPSLAIRPFIVDGVSFVPGIRDNDDVDTVLRYVVTQFAARVEPLHTPGCWGWSYRENRNSPNSLSNHASGTAVDVNAPKHPNGVPTTRTFNPAQVAEVHRILLEVRSAVRWGGDYTGTPDAMHFEINVDAATLHAVAEGLRDDMPSPKDWTAEDWAALQEKLAKPLVKAIWDASVTKAGTAVVAARKALRISAGLGD